MLDNANSFRENIFNKQVNFEFNVINHECLIENKRIKRIDVVYDVRA